MKKIKILFKNKNLMVLDKPAKISVHGDGQRKEETIADYILKNFKSLKNVGEKMFVNVGGKEIEILRPGIVHRLDKDTSGCLIVAKNEKAYQNLKKQFANKNVKKEYIALVFGQMKFDTGLINTPIARSKNDFRKKETVKSIFSSNIFRGEERDAVTRYKVLKRGEKFKEKLTLVAFYPETGRMHQIRVHAKSIGHPIVGDGLYGPKKDEFEKKLFKNTKKKINTRHLLHAKSISFYDPETGENIKVESKLPPLFSC